MKIKFLTLTILFVSFISWNIIAQEVPEVSPDGFNPPPTEKVDENSKKPMTGLEYKLTYAVLLFGFLIIAMEMVLTKLNKIDSHDSIKFILITLIITGTLFLITAGYSNNQIAPAMGLLGTIAGYLLGKQKTEL